MFNLIGNAGAPGSRRRIPALLATLALLAGCTASADSMVASSSGAARSFPAAWQGGICLRTVAGGDKWNLMSQAGVVEDAAFRTALDKTLQQNGLAAPPTACRYFLDVDILGISQPGQGLFVTSVQTDAHVNYKIYDPDRKPVFVDTVSTSYTEPFSPLPAAARAQRSSEGAVRSNFDQLLQHLGGKPPMG